jgi:hypothetical protein
MWGARRIDRVRGCGRSMSNASCLGGVNSGVGQYTSVAASRDGRRVVTTIANPTATLWRVPLLDRQAEDRDTQPYPLNTARALAPRFRGRSLFYLSSSGNGDGLWRVDNDQATEVSKGAEGGLYEPAACIAGRQPRGHRRQAGEETATGHRVGGWPKLANVSAVPRNSRSRRTGDR